MPTQIFFNLYTEHLKNQKNISVSKKLFLSEYAKVIDSNSDILTSETIESRPVIIKSPITNLYDIDSKHILQALKDTSTVFIKNVYGDPFYLNALFAIRRAYEHDKTLGVMVSQYTHLIIYSMLYRKYFTHGSANVDVMRYTINNLSMKFDIKKEGSLISALSKQNNTLIESKGKFLLSKNDDDFFSYIEAIRVRINAFIKNIYSEFDNNYKSKNYLTVDSSSATDKEGEEFDVNRQSISSLVESISDTTVKYINNNEVSENAMGIAIKVSDKPSRNKLYDILCRMKTTNSSNLTMFIRTLVGMYYDTEEPTKSAICYKNLIIFVFKLLKSNTSSKENIIHSYLNGICKEYDFKSSTLNSMKKSLIIYIAIIIQKANC